MGFLQNTVTFEWPKEKSIIPLSEILEKEVDDKYYASERIVRNRKNKHVSLYSPAIWHENKSGNISSTLEYTLFEESIARFQTNSYAWSVNNNGNLIGRDLLGNHKFTWQPHGSQFTIIYSVPQNAIKFSIKNPPRLDPEETLKNVGFSNEWVTITR